MSERSAAGAGQVAAPARSGQPSGAARQDGGSFPWTTGEGRKTDDESVLRPLSFVASWPAWLVGLTVTFAFTLPAWAPVLSPAFSLWQVDDGRLHLHRALFLGQLIRDGNWLPRWLPQQYGGYGYPTLTFYAPGLYYLVLALAALAAPFVGTSNGLYAGMQGATDLAALAVVLGTFLLVWELWRHAPAAFLAATSVAYAPYVIQGNVYISGSMTHVLGLAWMILLLAACAGIWQRAAVGRPAAGWWWAVALCTAGVLLAHNAVAAVAAVVAATWLGCLCLWRPSLRALLAAVTAAVAGALAVTFFWLPALLETALVQIENNLHGNLNYHNHFLRWPGFHREDVWGLQTRGPWTVGFPVDLHLIYPHSLYGPVRLGLWQAIIWLAALAVLAWQGTKLLRARRRHASRAGHQPAAGAATFDRRLGVLVVAYGLLLAAACYSQTFDWALPWWDRFAALRSIQLPSRLLAPAVFGLALALGGSMALCLRPGRRAWALAMIAAACLTVAGLGGRHVPLDPGVSHEMTLATAAGDERTQPGYTDSMDEFLPRTAGVTTWHENEARGFWLYERMFPEASWTGGRVRAWQGDVAIAGVSGRSLWTSADVVVAGPAGGTGGTVAFHQLAFPGWRAWVDGKQVAVTAAPPINAQAIAPGFLLVAVPPGSHQVAIRFGPDGPRLAGAALSLATLLAAGVWLLRCAVRERGPMGRTAQGAAGIAIVLAAVVMAVRTVLPLWPPG